MRAPRPAPVPRRRDGPLAAAVAIIAILAVIADADEAPPPAARSSVERALDILRDLPAAADILRAPPAASAPPGAPATPGAPGAPGAGAAQIANSSALPLVLLRQRNQVRARLALETVPIETPYGRLDIPIDDIVEIHFALAVAPATQERIDEAIAALGDDSFPARERASARLLELGLDAVPSLRRAAGSPDEEVRVRVDRLLEEIEPRLESADEPEPLVQAADRVTTKHFSILARVLLDSLPVTTPYGELVLPRGDLVLIRAKESGPARVKVDVPTSRILPSGWVETELTLEKGQQLEIEASGQGMVPDWGEICGPEGLGRTHAQFGGMRMLALVARIGKSGQTFAVGAKFSGRAPASGALHLAVVPFQYTTAVSGSYSVVARSR